MKKEVTLTLILILITPTIIAGQGTIGVTIEDSGDCNLDFKQGWNLFSFCSELTDSNLLNLLTPIDGKYLFIMEWDDIAKEFQIYSTLASDLPPFDIFNDDKSYFIYVTEDVTLELIDPESPIETRNLLYGWNAPSYPYRNSITIQTLTQDILSDVLFIMKWDKINKQFNILSFLSTDSPPFTQVNKGEGMFIYMEQDNSLTYI